MMKSRVWGICWAGSKMNQSKWNEALGLKRGTMQLCLHEAMEASLWEWGPYRQGQQSQAYRKLQGTEDCQQMKDTRIKLILLHLSPPPRSDTPTELETLS